jgi:hypothetical protein
VLLPLQSPLEHEALSDFVTLKSVFLLKNPGIDVEMFFIPSTLSLVASLIKRFVRRNGAPPYREALLSMHCRTNSNLPRGYSERLRNLRGSCQNAEGRKRISAPLNDHACLSLAMRLLAVVLARFQRAMKGRKRLAFSPSAKRKTVLVVPVGAFP